MRNVNDWEQIDLLDAIAEAEAKESGKKELCAGWKSAVRNENGCFTINSRVYPVGSRKDVYMELAVALQYPYIHFELSVDTGGPFFYGRHSPLNEDSMFSSSVFADPGDIQLNLTYAINGSILNDGNLSVQQKDKMSSLVGELVNKAMKDINGN